MDLLMTVIANTNWPTFFAGVAVMNLAGFALVGKTIYLAVKQ